ncbi:thiamine phosphate synthase [Calycomorphotria hydatis]|uniref:Thiamine-phosphate synthase n=1 Tax=Calycomorphotria hydatis TaxID=2528027 RepID=A0A517TBI5_9PLAN|nr:thiamine phosphate synthase [Calycomorphotria hydatis]QDT65727.1 Thiamine-phosphate synthase [Calycomorphotria hydatis]
MSCQPNFQPLTNTPAVERILALAAELARNDHTELISESHFLQAVFQDESRGAALLNEIGLTKNDFPNTELKERSDQLEVVSQHANHSDEAQKIIDRANRLARQQRQTELGSEHLAMGLLCLSQTVRFKLEELGHDPDEIVERLAPVEEPLGEPVPVDFGLDLESSDGSDAPVLDPLQRVQPPNTEIDSSVWRILDAAANRCREGLRVLEDYARFVLDDAHLSRIAKEQRHELSDALQLLPSTQLIFSRNTTEDVGTGISLDSEQTRETIPHLVTANAKRVQEALRTLEEYGKTMDDRFSRRMEALRYLSYTLERALFCTVERNRLLATHRLYLLLPGSGSSQFDPLDLAKVAIAGGVDVIQLREKELPDGELIAVAHELRALTRATDTLLIINDRPDIAAAVGADGVHLGQDDLSIRDARRILGTGKLIGRSTHTIEQARQAVLSGADYLGVGPTFPSTTKSFEEYAGLDFVRQVAAEIQLPWFAIGGINENNLNEVINAGAKRVAVSGAILNAESRLTATQQLKQELNGGSSAHS